MLYHNVLFTVIVFFNRYMQVFIYLFILCNLYLKENVRNFQKLKKRKYLIKYHITLKSFCLSLFPMFLANLVFVSHLKINPAVRLNTSKALTSLQSKTKVH